MRALLAAALVLAASRVLAADLTADEIVRKATDMGQPQSASQKTKMTLIDPKGGERVRTLEVKRLKTKDGWSTRIEFLEPKDVAGTVLLSVEKSGGVSQHLYLPGVKRVRKVTGGQRGGAFMGSDFSYEDLAPREVGNATYKLLADETVAGKACWTVEATPVKGAETGYTKSILSIAKDDYVTLRMRLFDKNGEAKVLDVDPAKVQVDGDMRIPKHMVMTKKADGHKTVIEVEAVDLGAKIEPSVFDPASLDRG